MRIAFETRWMTTSNLEGVGGYTINLLLELIRAGGGNSYVVLVDSEEKLRYLRRKHDIDSIPNLKIKLIDLSTASLFRFVFSLPRLLRKSGIDVYHSPHFVLSPMKQGYRMIATIYDLIPFLYPEDSIRDCPMLKFIYKNRWFVKFLMRSADAFAVSSTDIMKYAVDRLGFPQEKFHVIPPGIGAEYAPATDQGMLSQISNIYGIPRDCLLYLGEITRYTNVDILVDAYLRLDPDIRRAHKLVIIGRGENLYHRMSQRSSDIIMPGYIRMEDKPLVYSLPRALVHPVFYEGFPLIPLEAMACGVPVVASGIPQLSEFIGGAYLPFNNNDVRSLVDRLKQVLAGGAGIEELKRKGRAAAARYTWGRTAEGILGLYNKVYTGG